MLSGVGKGHWGRAVVALAALALVALTGRLGLWQLDRARQKTEIQQRTAERMALPPLAAAALARTAEAAAGQQFRQVQVVGRWLAQATVFLDNRVMDGQTGFIVVTPLLLAEGDAVLVQRGWVPRNFQRREALPTVDTPAGLVQLRARVALPPSRLFELGEEQPGRIRQNLDPGAFGREIGVALRPLSLQQLDASQALQAAAAGPAPAPAASADSSGGERLLRHWALPAADVGKHHGYAFQWFALSALTAGLYVWFQLIQPRRRR